MKRKTFAAQSVCVWMLGGETFAEAKHRLDELWKQGKHPWQVMQQRKNDADS